MATKGTSPRRTIPETPEEREARLAESRRRSEMRIRQMRLRKYRQLEDEERWDMLLEAADDWHRASQLRAFLRATEARIAEGAPTPPHVVEWLAWAWSNAEAFDPLGPSAPLKRFMRVKRRRNVPDHELPPFSIFDLR